MLRYTAMLLGLVCAARAQTPADWRFAHPDADLRLSVNVQAVLRSPAFAAAMKQSQAQMPKEQQAAVQQVLGLVSTIERISISARQKTVPKDSDVLVLVSGSFDPKTVQQFFPSKGTSQVRQIGPNALLIGETASFAAALRRVEGPASTFHNEFEQSDIWLDVGPRILTQPHNAQTPPAFRNIQAISLGLNLTESPELNLSLRATDAASAQQMLTGIQALMALAVPAPKESELLNTALQMRLEGDRLRVHFVAPPELMRAAQQQAASGAIPQLELLRGMLGLSSAPAKEPDTGGKIVIYGLDGGPREVNPQPTPPVVKLP
jgi:hypothetical protein